MNSKFTLKKSLIAVLVILMGCTSSDPGPAGLISLVRIIQEPIGTNCSSGGFKIETGVDGNKNSVLDNDEIQNSAYVCNGVNGNNGNNGSNGPNGLISLIKVTAENAGANCSSGGYRIDTGIDDNSNGTLEAAEIDNTIYVCNGSGGLVNYGKHTLVLYGDITNEEAAEIIASDLGTATQEVQILNCINLTAVDLSPLENAISIRIQNNATLKTVNLSGLKSLTGPLRISGSPELESLNVNALKYLLSPDDASYIYDTKLVNLSFPSLVAVLGSRNEFDYSLHIQDNSLLQSVSFPELTETNGVAIYIGSLTSFTAPKLVKGSVSVNGTFATFNLPEFTEGNVSVGSPLLTSLSLPKLTKGSVHISNSGLASMAIPELVEGDIQIIDNASLTSLSVPKFVNGYVGIQSNSMLGSLTIPELSEGSISIGDNDNLTSVNLPKLKTLKDLYLAGRLSTLTLPTLTSFGNKFTVYGKLSSAGVNDILSNLVQITPAITGSQIDLYMTPSAPPTGQGLTDKATLQANGNTVNTN